MRPIFLTTALSVAADDNGIALAQQLLAAGDLDLTGAALVSGGVAYLTDQRRVYLDSAGNLSGINFTVYGTDDQGRSIQETLAGPNTAPTNTLLDFFTVTRVAADAAVGTDVIVGTGDVGSSKPIPLDQYLTPFQVTLQALIDAAATVDATIQWTMDDIWTGYGPFNWTAVSATLTGITASAFDTLISPVAAVRILINSGADEVQLAVRQAGVQ